jgi:RHS repeat-associated protein
VATASKFLVYHCDHLGSIQAIKEQGTTDTNTSTLFANDAKSRESAYSYDPWGQRRDVKDWKSYPWGQSTTTPVFTWGWDDPTTTGANQNEDDLIPRGFTGHEMMDDLGLIHMNGRIYDPRLARFLSADQVVQAPWNLQSYNRYSYCMNNPLGYTDPTGYFGIPGAIMGAIVGGAIGAGVALWQGKSGAEIASATAGGAVSGALIGSGVGLISGALSIGAITGSTAIVESVAVCAVGSATGNVVTQVGDNMANGQSFSEAVTHIDEASVATSATVGGAVGLITGGAMAGAQAIKLDTQSIQLSMGKSIGTTSAELRNQGASEAVVSRVEKMIVNGMQEVGNSTANAVGAVPSNGVGGVAAATVEVISDAASVADSALNNASSVDGAASNEPVNPQQPVHPDASTTMSNDRH